MGLSALHARSKFHCHLTRSLPAVVQVHVEKCMCRARKRGQPTEGSCLIWWLPEEVPAGEASIGTPSVLEGTMDAA